MTMPEDIMTVEEARIPEKAERLEGFVGSWTVTGSLGTGDKQATLSGEWEFKRALDGWGVVGTMNTEIEGLGALEEVGVIALDTNNDAVHLFGASRFAIRDHVGDWVDDQRLRVKYEGIENEIQVTEEINLHLQRPGRVVARIVETGGEGMVTTTDLAFVRQADGSG